MRAYKMIVMPSNTMMCQSFNHLHLQCLANFGSDFTMLNRHSALYRDAEGRKLFLRTADGDHRAVYGCRAPRIRSDHCDFAPSDLSSFFHCVSAPVPIFASHPARAVPDPGQVFAPAGFAACRHLLFSATPPAILPVSDPTSSPAFRSIRIHRLNRSERKRCPRL